jgi:hypothetical protein
MSNINNNPPSEGYFQGLNYNSQFFQNNDYITYNYANTNYLSRVNIASSIATSTTFQGQIIGNGGLNINNGITSDFINTTLYLDVAGNDVVYYLNSLSGSIYYENQYMQSLSGNVYNNNVNINNQLNYYSLYLNTLSGSIYYESQFMQSLSGFTYNKTNYFSLYLNSLSGSFYNQNNYNTLIFNSLSSSIYYNTQYQQNLSGILNLNYFNQGSTNQYLYNYSLNLSGNLNNQYFNQDSTNQYLYNYALSLSGYNYSYYKILGSSINNNNLSIITLSSAIYIGNSNLINVKDISNQNIYNCYFTFNPGNLGIYNFNQYNKYTSLYTDMNLYYNASSQTLTCPNIYSTNSYSTFYTGTLIGSSTQCNQAVSILPILDSSTNILSTNYYLLYCPINSTGSQYRQTRNNQQMYWQNLTQTLYLPNINALGNSNLLNSLYTIGNNLNISGSLNLNSTLICNNNITLQTASQYMSPSINQLGYVVSSSLLVTFTQSGFNSIVQLFGSGYINSVGTYQILCDISIQGIGSDPAEISLIGISHSSSQLNDGINTAITNNTQISSFYSNTLNPYNYPVVGINNGGALSFSYLTLNFVYTITSNSLSQNIFITQANNTTYGNYQKYYKYHYYITRIA